MKVLILTSHMDIGGIPRYVLNLARGLQMKGHTVYVASRGGEWEPRLVNSGIETIRVPFKTKSILSFKLWSAYGILSKFLKEHPIDMIHCNTRVSQFLGYLLWKTKGIPYVTTYHGHYRPRFGRRILKCAGLYSVAISRDVERHLLHEHRIPAENVRMIYNGIDESVYLPALSKEESRRRFQVRTQPVIGIVARLTPEKNHVTLIEAFTLLIKDYPQATLMIVGKGSTEKRIREMIAKKGLQANTILMHGPVATEIIPSFDVSVLASLQEGFGLTVVESLILGVPVIVSNVGGLKEIIRDGVNGVILKDCRNPEELCGAIKNILRDEALRRQIIENGKRTVPERFSLVEMLDKIESVYRDAIQKNLAKAA